MSYGTGTGVGFGGQYSIIFLFFFLILFNPDICGEGNELFFLLIIFIMLFAFPGFGGGAC